MFIVLLKFTNNKERLRDFLDGHKQWLKQGYDAGIFLLSGSLQEQSGGAILAHNCSRTELQARLSTDPFVLEEIVSVDIVEVIPSNMDERLAFLLPE